MRHTPAGFRLKLGLKDVDLVLRTGEEVHAPMPVASMLHDRFVSSIAKGREDMDWSALALGAREDAGLPPPK
jgi:3-hydroxyisobutyrate dehydrogenase-like beta-hydroxyacid dehydrogenase